VLRHRDQVDQGGADPAPASAITTRLQEASWRSAASHLSYRASRDDRAQQPAPQAFAWVGWVFSRNHPAQAFGLFRLNCRVTPRDEPRRKPAISAKVWIAVSGDLSVNVQNMPATAAPMSCTCASPNAIGTLLAKAAQTRPPAIINQSLFNSRNQWIKGAVLEQRPTTSCGKLNLKPKARRVIFILLPNGQPNAPHPTNRSPPHPTARSPGCPCTGSSGGSNNGGRGPSSGRGSPRSAS
jgi:hypothetical protein